MPRRTTRKPAVSKLAGPPPARGQAQPAPPPSSSVDQILWDRLYRNGDYRKHWEYDVASQELVTVLAANGILFRAARGKTRPASPSTPLRASLDLGCGTGTEAIYLAEQGFESHGIDLSPVALAFAYDKMRRRALRVEWRRGNVLAMPYPDKRFSFVNDRGCFHHIESRDRPQYASEVARVLRKGGLFLLRGAAETTEEFFVPLRRDELTELFQRSFHLGPIQSFRLVSNAGSLPGLLVVMERK